MILKDLKNNLPSITNIATLIAVLIALVSFIWETRIYQKDLNYTVLFRYDDVYQDLDQNRLNVWNEIKNLIIEKSNYSLKAIDKIGGIQYLKIRSDKKEPLQIIEFYYLELNIQCLNLLNQICKFSLEDTRKSIYVNSRYCRDIAYYRNELDNLLQIRKRFSKKYLFTKPHYEFVMEFPIGDFCDMNEKPKLEEILD